MSRYFTRAAHVCTPSQHDADTPLSDFSAPLSMMVHEDEKETFTGLYDAAGKEIHRSERVPLGFIRSQK